jgi:phage terminase small subunit
MQLPPGVKLKDEPVLTNRQRAFVNEYLVDLNGTQAAIRAGYAESGASVEASRLLGNVNIAKLIAEAKEKRAEETGIDAAWVLRQAAKLHKRCMQEVRPKMSRKGPVVDENGNQVFEFNAAGAAKALELVGKHVGVQAFRDQLGLSNPAGGPVDIAFDPAKLSDAALAEFMAARQK